MHYRLSITIPTYNRADCLSELLDSIIEQIQQDFPVEICISDNASTDNTAEIVQAYQKQYPHIVYSVAPINQGFDRNLLRVVAMASGDYCWLMGSDDKIEDGALAYLAQILNQYDELTGISVNTQIYAKNLLKQLPGNIVPASKFTQDQLLHDSGATFVALGAYFGYLSGQIVKRKIWNEVVAAKDLSPYFNAYIHVYIIGRMLQIQPEWLYVEKRCVGWRSDNDSFLSGIGAFNRLQLDVVGYAKISKDLFGASSNIYKKFTQIVINTHIKCAIRQAKENKVTGFSWNALKLTVKYYWQFPAFWLSLLPVILMPQFIKNSMRWVYRNFGVKRVILQIRKILTGNP
ncbi:MAG: glycosyltransferase family 2 protein [Gammaproteobacteria bacterium]|nr:glycosyltransferase family 2 protein [Gammaproteobacteria bacterium]